MITKNHFIKKILGYVAIFCIILAFFLLSLPAEAASGNIDDIEFTETIVETTDYEEPQETEAIIGHLFVYKPKNYSANKKYDTLYLFEGLKSSENEALDNAGIKSLEKLFQGGMRDILVVVVPYDIYQNYTFDEIIATIDNSYSTNKKSSGRIIAGFSNGAYYIWNAVLTSRKYNAMADTYIPMSPIGAKKAISGNFYAIKKASDRIKIYNSCGDEGVEENYNDLYSGIEQMGMILENAEKYGYQENVNIFQYQAEGGHDWQQCWNVLSEYLPKILRENDTTTNK